MSGGTAPPPELTYALRVSIADLKPWEYDAMGFWQYERIRHAQQEWAKSQRVLPLRDPQGKP